MKQRIINFLLHKVLNTSEVEDIIQSDSKGNVYIDGKIVGDIEMRSLIAESKALEGMYLWKLINQKVKEDALDRGWNKSTSMDDLNAAKTMFYTLDLQNSIIKVILSRQNK